MCMPSQPLLRQRGCVRDNGINRHVGTNSPPQQPFAGWLDGQPFVATLFLPIAVVATAACVHMDEIVRKGMYIVQ